MKTYLILITILLASCSSSENELTLNNDTGDTTGAGETTGTGDTTAKRYPAQVGPTETPNLLVGAMF